ncbi:CLUMA_CG012299, isoform A [Clunio marinus]|uniref:CLUMA_CG012299, isoform A n=1 Tax=Clunio marinus TaxID=568069 RepID=A0A1J1IHA5_9DIPT|nr:CLUMA_CG012299, isoform A [Clunio marinus]
MASLLASKFLRLFISVRLENICFVSFAKFSFFWLTELKEITINQKREEKHFVVQNFIFRKQTKAKSFLRMVNFSEM